MVSSALPQLPLIEAGVAAIQAQYGDFPDVRLVGSDYMLYGVYQDLVHQNSGDHLDGVIAEDSKWQDRWKKLVCMPTQQYEKLSRKSGKIFVGILFVELDGIRARKWNAERVIFLNQLPFNVHKMLTIPRKFKSSFCFVSTCGIVDCLTIS